MVESRRRACWPCVWRRRSGARTCLPPTPCLQMGIATWTQAADPVSSSMFWRRCWPTQSGRPFVGLLHRGSWHHGREPAATANRTGDDQPNRQHLKSECRLPFVGVAGALHWWHGWHLARSLRTATLTSTRGRRWVAGGRRPMVRLERCRGRRLRPVVARRRSSGLLRHRRVRIER